MALFWTVACVTAIGYGGSQFAALRGDASLWARAVDSPAMSLLALVLFVLCVAVGAWPAREELS